MTTYYVTDLATAMVNLARTAAWWDAMWQAWDDLTDAIDRNKASADNQGHAPLAPGGKCSHTGHIAAAGKCFNCGKVVAIPTQSDVVIDTNVRGWRDFTPEQIAKAAELSAASTPSEDSYFCDARPSHLAHGRGLCAFRKDHDGPHSWDVRKASDTTAADELYDAAEAVWHYLHNYRMGDDDLDKRHRLTMRLGLALHATDKAGEDA